MDHLTQFGPIDRHSVELFQWELWGGGCTVSIEAAVAWVRTSRTSVLVMHRGCLVTEMGEYEATLGPLSELDLALRVASMAALAVGADASSELNVEAWTLVYTCPVADDGGSPLASVPEDWLSTGFDGEDDGARSRQKGVATLVWTSKNTEDQNIALLKDLVQRCHTLSADNPGPAVDGKVTREKAGEPAETA